MGYAASVGGADIIGAATGVVATSEAAAVLGIATGGTGAVVVMAGAGVVCGAGASYAAARTADPNLIKDEINYGNLDISIPIKFEGFSNVGIEHNNVIHNYFFLENDINNYYANNFNGDQIRILTSQIMIDARNTIKNLSIDYVNNNFDYKNFTNELLRQNLYTNDMKNVMDLFLQKYIASKSFSEIETTVNFYINEVSNSNLAELEKNALISSFVVASESPFYLYESK